MVDRHAATAKLDATRRYHSAAMLEDDLVDGVAHFMSSSPGGAVGENDRTRRLIPPAGTSARYPGCLRRHQFRTTSQMPLRQSR